MQFIIARTKQQLEMRKGSASQLPEKLREMNEINRVALRD